MTQEKFTRQEFRPQGVSGVNTLFGLPRRGGRRIPKPWLERSILRSPRPRTLPEDREARINHRAANVDLGGCLKFPSSITNLFPRAEWAVLAVLAIEQRKAGNQHFAGFQASYARRASCSVSTVYRAMRRAVEVGIGHMRPMERDQSRRSKPREFRFVGEAFERAINFGARDRAHRDAAWKASTSARRADPFQCINEAAHLESFLRDTKNTSLQSGLQPRHNHVVRPGPHVMATALVRAAIEEARCGGGQEAADKAGGAVEAERRRRKPRG